MDRDGFRAWIDGYEHAWRTAGTAGLRELFTDDAVYRHSPYAGAASGLSAIAASWEAEREGPDEVFTLDSEVVAIEGDTAVARTLVRYGDPVSQEYTNLWVVRFAADGRAREFEEWPFWPRAAWSSSGRSG